MDVLLEFHDLRELVEVSEVVLFHFQVLLVDRLGVVVEVMSKWVFISVKDFVFLGSFGLSQIDLIIFLGFY